MGHPNIDNRSPFAFEPVFIADEDMRPVVVTLIKATYFFERDGELSLAEEQRPVDLAGVPWTDAPVSSYKYEPETALCKLATDVVLVGQAKPASGGATRVDVGIKVGPVRKVATVFGDRFWVRTRQGISMSEAGVLETVPLTWENAFGGRDESPAAKPAERLEPRNPVGTGFGKPLRASGDRLRLPNIEDPNRLIDTYGAVVPPCGFGFTSPNWQPRAAFAGTYDEVWDKTRRPLLPIDFDRRFFNAAAPGLVAPGYLRGDEDVVVLNSTVAPRLILQLPGVAPPTCRVVLRTQVDLRLQTHLDTVIVDTDEQNILLLWRAHTQVGSGPHDVSAITVVVES